MKITTKFAGFLMSCMTLCAALQPVTSTAQNTEMARPRSTIDLSRTDRLSGTPNVDPTSVPSCPSGTTLSGGACVLISNQVSTGAVIRVPMLPTADGYYPTPNCPPGYVAIATVNREYTAPENELFSRLCAKN